MKKILVPVDFSEECYYGLNLAIKIAQKTLGQIFLLNCVPPPTPTFNSLGDMIKHKEEVDDEHRFTYELIKSTKHKMEDLVQEFISENVPLMPVIKVAELPDGVTEVIEQEGIDLVVMGTSGETAFSELLSGNHTEQVIRIFKCPVISVKKNVERFELKNILLATDLRTETVEKIEYVKRFAHLFNARIHVLHIADTDETEAEVRDKLANFAYKHQLENYSLNVLDYGDEVKGIRDFARQINADMIVAITHPRSSLADFIFRRHSISEELVEESFRPVLTLHSDY